MSFLFKSLRWRLIIGLLIPLVITRLISGYLNYALILDNSLAFEDRSLSELLSGIITSTLEDSPSRVFDDIKVAFDVINDTQRETFFYQIRSLSGEVLAGNPNLPRVDADSEIHFESITFRDKPLRAASKQINTDPPLLIQVAQDTSNIQEMVEDSWQFFFGLQAVMVFLIIVIVHVVIWLGFKPLERLRHGLLKRSLHDVQPLSTEKLPVEITPLVDSLNNMFTRLREDAKAQQGFFELASHQLKTPLAGIRSLIETSKREGIFNNHPQIAEQLQASVLRMQGLCEKLLSLVRVTSSIEQLGDMKKVNLPDLCREVIIGCLPIAESKQIELELSMGGGPEGTLSVQGNRAALRELITNLIDNAIRYSPPKSSISVTIQRDKFTRVIVEDRGQGIPNELKEKIFERFYRVLGNTEDGSGLGLSIAKEIAELHGARLFVEDLKGGFSGSRFVLEFSGVTEKRKSA